MIGNVSAREPVRKYRRIPHSALYYLKCFVGYPKSFYFYFTFISLFTLYMHITDLSWGLCPLWVSSSPKRGLLTECPKMASGLSGHVATVMCPRPVTDPGPDRSRDHIAASPLGVTACSRIREIRLGCTIFASLSIFCDIMNAICNCP